MTHASPELHSHDLDHLLARIALKDRQAFDILYAQTSGKLFAVAVRIMRNRAEAEDVLQEAFIRVWQRAQSFRPGQAKAMSWLIAITRNLAIDRQRAKRAPVAPIEMAEGIPDTGPTPEAATAASQDRARIEHMPGEAGKEPRGGRARRLYRRILLPGSVRAFWHAA